MLRAVSVRATGEMRGDVRLVAWNMGHQTKECPINELFHSVVKQLSPEILTLNEYVHGSSRGALIGSLGASGLTHWDVSDREGTNNQVLIASRYPFQRGDLKGPEQVMAEEHPTFFTPSSQV